MKSITLIRAQLSADRSRNIRCDTRLDFTGSALDLFILRRIEKLLRGLVRQLQRVQALWLRRQLTRIQAQLRQLLILIVSKVELQPLPPLAFEAHETAAGVEQ